MRARRKRITIAVDEATWEVIAKLSFRTGKSVSKLCSEFLEQALRGNEEVREIMNQVQKDTKTAWLFRDLD